MKHFRDTLILVCDKCGTTHEFNHPDNERFIDGNRVGNWRSIFDREYPDVEISDDKLEFIFSPKYANGSRGAIRKVMSYYGNFTCSDCKKHKQTP